MHTYTNGLAHTMYAKYTYTTRFDFSCMHVLFDEGSFAYVFTAFVRFLEFSHRIDFGISSNTQIPEKSISGYDFKIFCSASN